uniref:Poly [ADP-ribose] polymerase n=1 Tax=Cynoglossus semilaevis TaxID=244447 RepID=A0A3P8WV42_CYNSE
IFLLLCFNVSKSQKCLIKLCDQSRATPSDEDTMTVATYTLRDGPQVVVCQGDITKQKADALVNAANEDLEHYGGVAAELSRAGGPTIQKESRVIVKCVGKIPTGDVVVTTGGHLCCKTLLHVVGPRKNCKKILQQCEDRGYQSVAFPAINTGLYKWEPMNGESFKKVKLNSTLKEYKKVAEDFKATANHNIITIERVQNVYQWKAFAVCKERIGKKNGLQELGEKFLYHGTAAESCDSIEKGRFDRSFAGQHATMYGKGVYFAVNAQYSARGYSQPDASGTKRMYVARVLTGRYTKGEAQMKNPPPRANDPTDRYDSLVDNCQKPNMFVIFHDDQAYPEYLITFN